MYPLVVLILVAYQKSEIDEIMSMNLQKEDNPIHTIHFASMRSIESDQDSV